MADLELYRVFYAVAKCGAITKAADQLYISQPAVSQAIKQLEAQLGMTLFNRTHKGMELTQNGGKLIFAEVEQALQMFDSAENKIMEMQSYATGTLRIGATDAIFSHVLPDRIVEYHEKNPGVKIELVTGTSPETIEQLKENRVDVAFLNLPVADRGINLLHTMSHLNDVFIAGENFSELKGRKVSLSELQSYPLVMIESNTIARRSLSEFTENLGISLAPDVEVASWDFLTELVSRGMGVGCVPREYCREQIDRGSVFVVDTTPSLPVRGIGIALTKSSPRSFALKQFVGMFD